MVFDTIVLVEPDGRHYIKSEAVLRIASRLRQPFPQLASLARLFPVDFRDSVYAFVSARRHIFGESENCRCVSHFHDRSTACVAGRTFGWKG
jgi:predicted DCC family thiol-disulfide oxidoreductase YuxK